MNDLPQSILDAIEKAVASQADDCVPLDPETIRASYIAQARQLLEAGKTEADVVKEFNQIANS